MTPENRIKELEDALKELDMLRHDMKGAAVTHQMSILVQKMEKPCLVLYRVHEKDRMGGKG